MAQGVEEETETPSYSELSGTVGTNPRFHAWWNMAAENLHPQRHHCVTGLLMVWTSTVPQKFLCEGLVPDGAIEKWQRFPEEVGLGSYP